MVGKSWIERTFGFHWCQWEDLERERGAVLKCGDWLEVEWVGKIHQRCKICGAHRRIDDR